MIHLKTYWHNNNFRHITPVSLITISKAARPRYISYYSLKTYYEKRRGSSQIIFLLFTCYGLVTSEEILNLHLQSGGIALGKFI